jgi:Ca2+-binding RTX toxin-like protein
MAVIIGNSTSQTHNGSPASDLIEGLGGNDTLNGLGGVDVLLGGTGNDILRGGSGFDVLEGGLGNDVFDYNNVSESPLTGRDIILDFELQGDNDTINVHDIDANTGFSGNQNFFFSHYSESNGSGPVNTAMWVNQPQSIHADTQHDVVYANVDNDAAPELVIQIPGLTLSNISFSDFIA